MLVFFLFGFLLGNLALSEATDINTAAETQARNNFVNVYSEFLNTLTGKAGILTNIALVGDPVVAALRALDSSMDNTLLVAIQCQLQFTADPNTNSAASNALSLIPEANSITLVNAPLLLVGLGPFPKIIAGIQQQINFLNAAFNANQNSPQYTPCDSTVTGSITASKNTLDVALQNAITAYTPAI